jgi:hypothetical protein
MRIRVAVGRVRRPDRPRCRRPSCESVEFDAGHAPVASQPTAITDLIDRAAGRARVGAAGSIALALQLAAFAGLIARPAEQVGACGSSELDAGHTSQLAAIADPIERAAG